MFTYIYICFSFYLCNFGLYTPMLLDAWRTIQTSSMGPSLYCRYLAGQDPVNFNQLDLYCHVSERHTIKYED